MDGGYEGWENEIVLHVVGLCNVHMREVIPTHNVALQYFAYKGWKVITNEGWKVLHMRGGRFCI